MKPVVALRALSLPLAVLFAFPGVVSSQHVIVDEVLTSPHVSIAVNDDGTVAAVVPTKDGSWVLVSERDDSDSSKRTFVPGVSLRHPRLFPDGRLAVDDTGGIGADFPLHSMILEPFSGTVVWNAQHPGPYSFSPNGRMAAWMPCYYCASADSKDPVAQVARRFLKRGLTVALANTAENGTTRVVSFDGPGFRWNDVSEVIGTGAFPLDEAGSRILVVWNGFPYLLENEQLQPFPVPEDMGPVRNTTVGPDGVVVVFGLDMGEYAAFDTRSGEHLWTTRNGSSSPAAFFEELGDGIFEGPARVSVHPLDRSEALIEFSHGLLVRYAFDGGKVLARKNLAVQGRSSPGSSAILSFAVSPRGRFVAVIDRSRGSISLTRFDDFGDSMER